jgi:predicted nucleic acid-binding protein
VNVGRAFAEADDGQALIYIPAIVIGELYYLNEKKGRPLNFRTKYARLAHSRQFVLLPFHPSHTLDFDACSAVTEMHDRMIVADARRTEATLLTRDVQITNSGVVATVW